MLPNGGRGARSDTTSRARERRRPARREQLKPTEHQTQAAFMEWRDRVRPMLPELAMCFAVPNGGYREDVTAALLKAEGVEPGCPDVLCLVPRHGYHGMAIEFKALGGTPSPAQQVFIANLRKYLYYCIVSNDWVAAAREICWYLDADPQAFLGEG